jgi:hypothetical protein
MPPLEQDDFVESVLLWPVRVGATAVNRFGQIKVYAVDRQEIPVRWKDVQDDVRRPDGSVVKIEARIATGGDVPMGSYLWRGTDDDLVNGDTTGTGSNELPVSNIMQVVTREIVKDVRGREVRYEYGLAKWGHNLPTV